LVVNPSASICTSARSSIGPRQALEHLQVSHARVRRDGSQVYGQVTPYGGTAFDGGNFSWWQTRQSYGYRGYGYGYQSNGYAVPQMWGGMSGYYTGGGYGGGSYFVPSYGW
jgi:hypothetical protein